MDNKEAIEWLEYIKNGYSWCANCDKALDKAIASLEILEQEPCEDVIDRAEAMTEIMMFAENVKFDEEDIYIKVSDAVQLLRDLPSVMARLKKGHWIKIGAYQGKCSCCNNCVIDEDENFGDYCRHCGADMRGDE